MAVKINKPLTLYMHMDAIEFSRHGLFIGGCPKSGTTLLLSMLDGHPQLVVLPEETFYLEERRRYEALPDHMARLKWLLEKSNLRILGTGTVGPQKGTGPNEREYNRFDFPRFVALAKELVGQPGMNDALLFSEVVRAYAMVLGLDWKNCVRWVEKSTSNEVQHEAMAKLYPDAKLVKVVRDPRAVFASRKKFVMDNPERQHTKAHRLVREWNRSAREIPRLRQQPERFLVIRYEDLVKNPEEIIQAVCRHAGIDFAETLLQPTRVGADWGGNSAHHAGFSGVDASTADLWRKKLSPHEVWWIELHCRKGMEIAGYALETSAKFSIWRWLKRLPDESWSGYGRARRASFCQWLGLIKECRYDK